MARRAWERRALLPRFGSRWVVERRLLSLRSRLRRLRRGREEQAWTLKEVRKKEFRHPLDTTRGNVSSRKGAKEVNPRRPLRPLLRRRPWKRTRQAGWIWTSSSSIRFDVALAAKHTATTRARTFMSGLSVCVGGSLSFSLSLSRRRAGWRWWSGKSFEFPSHLLNLCFFRCTPLRCVALGWVDSPVVWQRRIRFATLASDELKFERSDPRPPPRSTTNEQAKSRQRLVRGVGPSPRGVWKRRSFALRGFA